MTLTAVQNAIDAGRLRQSVGRDEHGTRKIADVELADHEWRANTMPRAGQPDTRPPVRELQPQPEPEPWPVWAPEWLRDYEPTRDELLADSMRGDALVKALAALHLDAPDPVAALDAFLARLAPHLPPIEAPGMSTCDSVRMHLHEALNPDDD